MTAVRVSSGSVAGAETAPGLDPAWSRTVDVVDAAGRTHRWHYLETGPGAGEPVLGTLVCLHGNPTWSYLWRRFLAEAPAGWRVVAPDQLGMGWSDRTAEPRRLADRIDDLDRFLAAVSVEGPVVIAAHDWGGPVALGWAGQHPDRVRGLVVANTGLDLGGERSLRLIRLAARPALRDRVCVDTPVFVRATTGLSKPALSDEVRAAYARPYTTAVRRRAVGDFVADVPFAADHPSAGALADVAAGLERLRQVPALLLWGPRDPVFTEAFLHDLLARLPQAEVHRYPRASHLVTEDAPQTAENAWRWIRTLDAHAYERPAPPDLGAPLDGPLRDRADDPATAIVELSGSGRTVTTWRDLAQRVDAMAGGLASHGVTSGDRVALLVRPGIDLTAAVYACWRLGAVIVVADAGLGLKSLGNALRSANPAFVLGFPAALGIVSALRIPGRRIVAGSMPRPARRLLHVEASLGELADRGLAAPVTERDDDADAAVLFTSGATGPPKGVVYTQGQLRVQVELFKRVLGIGPEDRLVAAFAPFALYGPAMGAGVAVPDMDLTKPGTLTATALAEAVAAVDGTVVFASPAALRNVVATSGALSTRLRTALGGVQRLLSAGAPVPVSLLQTVRELMPHAELHTPYGMTELLPLADIDLTAIEAAGRGNGVCVGHPIPEVTVRISPLDELGRAPGPPVEVVDVTGEICASAPHRKDRYDRLWATEQTSSRDPGWHRTGDVGHVDAEGRLWVEGRLVHVVATAAGPVTPVGIEQRVEALSGVRAAAVVGVGPAGTQQVVVVVVPTSAESREVMADPQLAAEVRAAAAVPVAAVLLVEALPVDIRHASKVDRGRLAVWATRVLSGGRAGQP